MEVWPDGFRDRQLGFHTYLGPGGILHCELRPRMHLPWGHGVLPDPTPGQFDWARGRGQLTQHRPTNSCFLFCALLYPKCLKQCLAPVTAPGGS